MNNRRWVRLCVQLFIPGIPTSGGPSQDSCHQSKVSLTNTLRV